MTDRIEHLSPSRSLLDMVERASLFALLQQAMQHQKRPQDLPPRLYEDVGFDPTNGAMQGRPGGD